MKGIKQTTFGCMVTVIGICFLVSSSVAALTDVGMVTRLEGKVTYSNEVDKQTQQNAQNFMKVRNEDRFDLEAGAQVQLVFFGSGRKETWKGPASFKLTQMGCETLSGEKNFVVSSLPEAVSKEMQRISPLLDPDKLHRSGATIVRGRKSKPDGTHSKLSVLTDEEKKVVEGARKTYQTLSASLESDDITPELYLFSILADYDQSEEMASLLKRMRDKQPKDPAVDRLEKWLESQR